jgi:two-component sensor histidine kinase
MQRQLAVTRQGLVELRPYLTELCASIGASMIRDHDKVSLDVDIDGSSVDAEASVSLGLIVTELVINALKHGYPGEHRGCIEVDFAASGPDWRLTVSDDGVGRPPQDSEKHVGLGTTIVDALARNLKARVEVRTGGVGASTSIIHSERDTAAPPSDS